MIAGLKLTNLYSHSLIARYTNRIQKKNYASDYVKVKHQSVICIEFTLFTTNTIIHAWLYIFFAVICLVESHIAKTLKLPLQRTSSVERKIKTAKTIACWITPIENVLVVVYYLFSNYLTR